MASRKLTEAIRRFAQSQKEALLPYPTADKIVAEVLKNGSQARETVMLMLLEYLDESLKSKESGLAQLREELSKKNPGPLD